MSAFLKLTFSLNHYTLTKMIFNNTYKNSGVLSSSVESEVAGLQELFIKITVGHILANHCAQREKL